MNTYYDRIMEFLGADELKMLVKRWDVLSDNISTRALDAPIVLPDLFIYTKPGFGNTRILSLLSEYLDSKKNLMSFYGDVKFFEFKLEYTPPKEVFKELYRLIEAVEAAAGFRNEFRGLIRIDVNDWVGHHKEKHFLDFLKYLKSGTNHWMIILTLSKHNENEETKEMEAVVSMFLRIEKLTLRMPETQGLVDYAQTCVGNYGLRFDEGAQAILKEAIDVLRENKYFYGFHTVSDFCNDIVYALFSEKNAPDSVITKDMMKDFSADSEYIKRTVIKIKKSVTLGF